jgi:hypothetical protein
MILFLSISFWFPFPAYVVHCQYCYVIVSEILSIYVYLICLRGRDR